MRETGSFSGTYQRGLELLIRIQDGRCAYCYCRFQKRGKHRGWTAATQEHVWPKRAGHERHNNIVAACRQCNEEKGDAMPTGCEILALEWVNAKRHPGCVGHLPDRLAESPHNSKSAWRLYQARENFRKEDEDGSDH